MIQPKINFPLWPAPRGFLFSPTVQRESGPATMPNTPTPPPDRNKPHTPAPSPTTVLELRVQNHPGAMARITALFADGGFNLEAILCVPLPGGIESRMLLLVSDAHRLGHVEGELARLPDILALRRRADLGPEYFEWMAEMGAGAQGHHR